MVWWSLPVRLTLNSYLFHVDDCPHMYLSLVWFWLCTLVVQKFKRVLLSPFTRKHDGFVLQLRYHFRVLRNRQVLWVSTKKFSTWGQLWCSAFFRHLRASLAPTGIEISNRASELKRKNPLVRIPRGSLLLLSDKVFENAIAHVGNLKTASWFSSHPHNLTYLNRLN